MNKLIIKYIGMFFLFLILVLGCMGFIIYDKLMIEYEKHIKEVIMWNIDNSEIKDQGTNIAQWDNIGNEIERIKRLSSPTEMFKELSQGVKSEDFLQSEIAAADLKPLIDAGTRQLKRAVEIQNIVFDSQSFSDKVYGLVYTDKYKDRIGEGDVEDIGLNLGYALQRNMSDKEFSVYMRKEYSKATKDDIRVATEFYKDVSLIFNQEMNSKYNDISLKNYDSIMKAYNDHKEYFGKDSKTFKSLINPKDVFDRLKGSNGKERLFISSLLATLPTEDLVGMLKDKGTKGFNAIMELLDSRPENRNSFNSAITAANEVLGNMGSNIGPDIIKAVMLHNSMGLENLVAINPNIANLSVNDRVYRNILDDDGNVIGREDTGLLRNNYNPMMFVELAKLLKGLEDKRLLKNQGKNMINQGL
ncbi:hypothetical protein [Campylobacter vicugnae]|uniref:Uncharacterized protein n=2 Tax=Campylobacter vicugnae TaxID=1660076 RepID=A0ABZ2E8Q6_9BACT|nr:MULTISPECIES: hypothetical protein [unclassified Campylobacter]